MVEQETLNFEVESSNLSGPNFQIGANPVSNIRSKMQKMWLHSYIGAYKR